MNPLLLFFIAGWLSGWFVGYNIFSNWVKPSGFVERIGVIGITSVLWFPILIGYGVWLLIKGITSRIPK